MKKVIIIGSGIAGISTSIRLRRKGYEVDVYEANSYPGGKLTSFTQDGFRFDAGPSLFTLPNLVEELFELFDERAATFFQYKKKQVVCNYFWEDGMTFSADANPQRFIQEASECFGVAAEKISAYLDKSKRKYQLTAPIFLEQSLHKVSTYLSGSTIKALWHTGMMDITRDLNAVNHAYLGEPHLVQLFNRYATYNGSSPYKTPGIMSMIPHLEMHIGTFFPKGGMQSISSSLYEFACKKGVQFHFSKAVDRILVQNKRATGVKVEGQDILADVVVSNMDIFSSYRKLMPDQAAPERTLRQERSSSALIFYWGIEHAFEQFDLHNILFSNDYKAEFEYLFDRKQLYKDPTVYVNITCKEEVADAPEGCENWFVMINAPANYGQDWTQLIREARQNIIDKIKRISGIDLEPLIRTEAVLDPRMIEQKTSSYRGALYGAASNSKFTAFLRHPNFSQKIRNLFFCGGSVHPGGGIPLCLLSAKIVADQIPDILSYD